MIKIFGFVIMRKDEYDAAVFNVLQEGIEYGIEYGLKNIHLKGKRSIK